jgi:hypothetical protein
MLREGVDRLKNVTEFFYRTLGPILLISALALFNTWYSASSKYLSLTKQTYTQNSVYEESSLAATDESQISGREMKAILMAGPNQNMVISARDCKISIHAGSTTTNFVKVTDRVKGEIIGTYYFGKGRWNADVLKLDDWIADTDNFQSKAITYSTGEVRRMYYKLM